MTKLNKQFLPNTRLTAAELNAVTGKIDELIDNWPLIVNPPVPDDEENDISEEIQNAKDWITGKIEDLLALIDQFEAGHTTLDDGNSFLNLFKGLNGKAALLYYGLLDSDGHPFFNVLIDENGVKPAAIIGAITDNNGILNSQIGISADNVIIDANTTLTGKLNILDVATIKQAVINDLTTNNLTITGTLTYNKIIGNVQTVSTSSQLADDAYFVEFTGSSTSDVSLYPVITLPANNLVEGQTLFILLGTKCFKIQSNSVIQYFTKLSTGVPGEYQILGPVSNPVGTLINVFEAGWNGIVLFIYTASGWILLIHNINI